MFFCKIRKLVLIKFLQYGYCKHWCWAPDQATHDFFFFFFLDWFLNSPVWSFEAQFERYESVGSSKQVCLIDQSLDNILSSFSFCCVVMSLDVIATTTLETGQPTFCPSDWTAALHWRPYYDSWWNNKIFYEVIHIIKSHISKCVQEVKLSQ